MELQYALEQQSQSLAGAIARRAEEAGLIQKSDEFSREWHERYGEDWARVVRNSRWFHDRGAIPGEPYGYLDFKNGDLNTVAAVIVELDSPEPHFLYEAFLADGTSLGVFEDGEAAQVAAEAAVASRTVAQAHGTAAPSHGTESGAAPPARQAPAQAGRAGEIGGASSNGSVGAGGLQGFGRDLGSGFGGGNA